MQDISALIKADNIDNTTIWGIKAYYSIIRIVGHSIREIRYTESIVNKSIDLSRVVVNDFDTTTHMYKCLAELAIKSGYNDQAINLGKMAYIGLVKSTGDYGVSHATYISIEPGKWIFIQLIATTTRNRKNHLYHWFSLSAKSI